MDNKHEVFNKDFNSYVIKWGKITNWFGVLLVFVPCVVLLMIGGQPSWAAVGAGVLGQVSINLAYYFVEPISYFPTLGISGTYMAFLSGNISNMRVPCARVSQEAVGVEPGTDEGSVISTIGVAVSVVVNALVLTLTVIFGTALLSRLPESVTAAFGYLLPSLFAAMLTSSALSNLKVAKIGLPLGLLMVLLYKFGALFFIPTYVQVAVVLIISVFGTIGIGFLLDKKEGADANE